MLFYSGTMNDVADTDEGEADNESERGMIQINAAAMARWADGSSCTLDQQIRDDGMASFVIGHALQVFSGTSNCLSRPS
jgi:hypothetical protein